MLRSLAWSYYRSRPVPRPPIRQGALSNMHNVFAYRANARKLSSAQGVLQITETMNALSGRHLHRERDLESLFNVHTMLIRGSTTRTLHYWWQVGLLQILDEALLVMFACHGAQARSACA